MGPFTNNFNCAQEGFWLLAAPTPFSAQLSPAQLSSAPLSSGELSSAQLSSVQLSSAQLSSAQLSPAQLSSAQLSSAQLRPAQLSSAQFSPVPSAASEASRVRHYVEGMLFQIARGISMFVIIFFSTDSFRLRPFLFFSIDSFHLRPHSFLINALPVHC